MTGSAGTGQLTSLAFRRDRVMLPACVWGIVVVLAITARDLKVLYPTPARRLAVAAGVGENPALRFLLGRLNGTSVGAFLAARWGVWGAAAAARDTAQRPQTTGPDMPPQPLHQAHRTEADVRVDTALRPVPEIGHRRSRNRPIRTGAGQRDRKSERKETR